MQFQHRLKLICRGRQLDSPLGVSASQPLYPSDFTSVFPHWILAFGLSLSGWIRNLLRSTVPRWSAKNYVLVRKLSSEVPARWLPEVVPCSALSEQVRA